MKRIVLHIDNLVLHGFQHADRQSIADGLQQELVRQFTDSQAAQQLVRMGNVARLRIGSVSIGQNTQPQRIGAQVAQGISRGMKA
jgi:hypothetical protein